jgi:hypothetical protein
MRKIFLFPLLFVVSLASSQVEPIPVVSNDKNWTSSISYNFSGATISKGVNYFSVLGNATQQQNWDVLTGRVWAQEVRYDSFNRPFFQTLSAPIGNTTFAHKPDFIYANGTAIGSNLLAGIIPYTYTDWLTGNTVTGYMYLPNESSTTPCVDANQNSLGWYYSNSNTLDPY